MHSQRPTSWALLIYVLGLLALAVAAPPRANADAFFSGEQALQPGLFLSRSLPAGLITTIETRTTSSGGDPVLHVLQQNGSTFTEVAADDDSGPGLDSRVQFIVQVTGTYLIYVHPFSNTSVGTADLVLNGTTLLSGQPYAHRRVDLSWTYNQEFRVTGTERGSANDSMLFLLQSNTHYLQHDDDSGPKLYSYLVANSTESGSSRAFFGLFPGSTGRGHLTKEDMVRWLGCCDYECRFADCTQCDVGKDSDCDSISNELESQIGSTDVDADTDNDAIGDIFETFGNEGFSFSEGDPQNPTKRNIYVEVDFMVGGGAGQNRTPYSALNADMKTIFSSEANTRIDVFVDNSLPFSDVITFGSCSGVTNCVTFSSVKAANFSSSDAFKRERFHYAVYGSKSQSNRCTSGVAELLGNDLIVSLGSSGGCGWAFSAQEQRGTTMHELGHNLRLDHNGNDSNTGANGTAHKSVMNYRFQTAGIDTRTGLFTSSYSFGTNACAPCSTSPKQACINLKNQNKCNTVQGSYCDCDVAEWSLLDLDFMENPGTYKDGERNPPLGEDPAASVRRGARLKDLDSRPDTRPESQATTERKRAYAAKKLEKLEAKGLIKNKHFVVSDDNLHFYSVEQ
jgi:hypothetical protein